MIYILFGADSFSLRNRLTEIRASLGEDESVALNTNSFEGQQLTLSELAMACEALPFLGSYRLVIVEGLLGRFGKKEGGQKGGLGEWTGLDGHLSAMPQTTTLVLVDGELQKTNPLLKRLASISRVEQFPPMKRQELLRWVHSQVTERDATITAEAVNLLVDFTGDNLWALSSEIEKLCLYARGRRIEVDDIRQVTAYAREASIFALVDAIVERRASVAMRSLHQSLTEGMTPAYVLVMLTRQLRLMVQAKGLQQSGLSPVEKQRQLGVSANYPMQRLLRQAAAYPMLRLVEVYERLLETDTAIKTGRRNDKLALDLLVAEVCA